MGFFGGDNDNQQSESNALLDKQMQQNAAELESKRKSLFEQRLAIVKSSGGTNWTGGPKLAASIMPAQNPGKVEPSSLGGKE